MQPRRTLWCVIPVVLVALSVAVVRAQSSCPPTIKAPTAAEMQDAFLNARDRGALWRFEKDGRPGYLYGTMHVGKFEWAMPGRLVSQALRDADTIAFEADLSDPAILAGMRAPAKPEENPSLPVALMDRLRAQAARACMPWERLATLPPTMILATLVLQDARWQGLHAEYGSEIRLLMFAQAAGKHTASLESVATQRSALSGGSAAEQIAWIDEGLTALEKGNLRDQLTATANSWFSGDLDALARFISGRPAAERAILDRAVTSRNPGMAARIEELHKSGRRVFAATGIMHMVGDTGLPKLLADRGFKIERVTFGAN